MFMRPAGKDMAVWIVNKAAPEQVLFQRFSAGLSNDDPPGFITLSRNCESGMIPVELDIANTKIADFLSACTAGIH